MGIDVDANLVYGIKLPEEWKISDSDISAIEALEDIIYPYDGSSKYPNLDIVIIGDCDEPDLFIGCKSSNFSVRWTSIPITEDLTVDDDELEELYQFMEDFSIKLSPSWHLGCYVSY